MAIFLNSVNVWTVTVLISVHVLTVWKFVKFVLKENRTENVKMLLQNNFINNSVTIDLK